MLITWWSWRGSRNKSLQLDLWIIFVYPSGIREYVLVVADFSAGRNRAGRFMDLLLKLTAVDRPPTSPFTSHFVQANWGGNTRRNGPFVFLTPANPRENFRRGVTKQQMVQTVPDLVSETPTGWDWYPCLPVEKLLDKTVSVSRANREKGWCCDKLVIRTVGSSYLNEKEYRRLYTELLLRDQYFGDKAKAAVGRIQKW